MKNLVFYLVFLSIIISCNNVNNNNQLKHKVDKKQEIKEDIYKKAGVIKIKDPFALHTGYEADSNGIFFISLKDVAKYHGKVCPGIATGFFMIKQVLDSLYPGNSIPERGDIKVACSRGSDLLDIAGFVTGARSFYGRSEINKGDLVVDTTLNPHQTKSFAMVFARKDTNLAYKVIFHKELLIDSVDRKFMFTADKKALAGELDYNTERKFKELIRKYVENILTNGPKSGVYEITKCKDYKF
jgi:formylmethanofuran dehydrogenase subunit E